MADFNEKFNELNDTPDTTSQFDAMDIQNNKAMAILAYIGILVLVPLLAAKESRFARFHANQGLVLLIAEIICGVLSVIPILGFLFSLVGYVGGLVFMVLGIINAAKGQAKELPIIGKFRLLK